MVMSTALAIRPEFDAEKVALIKRMIAPNANADELALFVQVCQKTGLDPFARQIYCIHRKDKFGVPKMGIQTSIDGFRLIAERTRHYAGQLGPFWCGEDGVWKDVWLDKKAPSAAKVAALRDDFKEPLWRVANWNFYAQSSPLWTKGGPHMLAKCAEALALRAAFPQELSGLYTTEEMGQADATYTPPPQPKEGSPSPKADSGPTSQSRSTQTTSSGPTTATTKRPRAPSIKHDGTFASHKQVAYIHALKNDVGEADCKGECAFIVQEYSKRAGGTVEKTKFCQYHTRLMGYKDVDGKAITTSKDLSEAQASDLISRYEGYIATRARKAAEVPDLDAAFSQAEENARIRGELGPGADG